MRRLLTRRRTEEPPWRSTTTAREKSKARIRKKLSGTTERPRLTVYKSLKHIYAQVVDDTTGNTLAFASSLSKELKGKKEGDKKADAKRVGTAIAEVPRRRHRRGGVRPQRLPLPRPHRGRAEAAREAGLKF